jgi:hypothetical protein
MEWKRNGNGQGYIYRHGLAWTRARTLTWNWGAFAKYKNSAIVSKALYELLMTNHHTISNSALYLLVLPLPDENKDMQIFKDSYRHWDCSQNDVLAEWKYQGGFQERLLSEVCTVFGN